MKNKQYEYIRAVAIVGVICIHTMYSALLQFEGSYSRNVELMYSTIMNLMWWAVPCFLMLTGSLLLDDKREVTIKKLYSKYILRMLVVLFTVGTFYSWLEIYFVERYMRPSQLIRAIYNVFIGNTWAHMWYIYCLLGLYVLLPVYKLIATYATDTQIKYILFVLLIFESILKLGSIVGIESGFYCHINTIYPFWILMGVAWNRKLININMRISCLIFIVVNVMLAGATILDINYQLPINILFGYDSIIVVVQSVALFALMNHMRENNFAEKFLLEIGDKSFGIYLVHMFFINIFYKVFNINPMNRWGGILGLILIIVNLGVSYLAVWVLKKIPIIKRFI